MKKNFTRRLSLVLAICMVVSLAACGSSQPTAQQSFNDNVADNAVVGEQVNGVQLNADADASANDIKPADKSSQSATVAPAPLKDNKAESGNKLSAIVDKVTDIFNKPESVPSEENSNQSTGESPEVDENISVNTPENKEPQGEAQAPVVKPNENGSTSASGSTGSAPVAEYNKGVVLVKSAEGFNEADLGELAYTSAEPLYNGSKWYSVKLADESKTEEAVAYLDGLENFAEVDYDYIMGTTTEAASVDISGNPDADKQTNLGLHNIPNGWTHNGKHPGGSPDVVVAVIDTGVDYNHLDLRNNIWVNNAEIPDNNKDDDGNGYVDDVYGWDCVGNDNDPMDDNGHGTHVAGIIAAENNKVGGIGVAFNCKVMVLKAGNSSGYFNNSDIAEAIQYAYMNGASVINMSFGGNFISIAVEEALETAYETCVLVAAAGNDSACNNLSCKMCDVRKVSYPAALPYVIGVMSVDDKGQDVSSFSNYDHYPYDSIEYEVYAVGEYVHSCWPANKYAQLNGTSMAAPTVSGIAALLRSEYSDRNTYSTKYIQSQIVNTGTVNPYNYIIKNADEDHSVADVYEAMTRLPKPDVNLYSFSINDSTTISSKNNGNGIVDAGETIRLSVALHNRGGVANNINVSIDTQRSEGLTDPYFTFVNSTMKLSDIGTYSVRESGEDNYFEIIVSDACPNDYLVDFNIRFTYTNGMDKDDKTVYSDNGKQKVQFNVSSGYHIPAIISEDTVFTNDRLYIVGENVMVPAGVTVTFEEGCRIQFYDDREYYNSPRFVVYGTLNMEGSEDDMIDIYPSERYPQFCCIIENRGIVELDYVKSINLYITSSGEEAVSNIYNSYLLSQTSNGNLHNAYYYSGGSVNPVYDGMSQKPTGIYNSYIEVLSYAVNLKADEMKNNYIVLGAGHYNTVTCSGEFSGNIVYSEEIHNLEARKSVLSGSVENNMFITSDESVASIVPWTFKNKALVSNNSFSPIYREYANQVITDYLDSNGTPTVDVFDSCSDITALYPHVVSVEIFNADGEQITVIGKEEIKVRVTFNRPMDTQKDTYLTFGTILPFADYKINGAYVSDTVWEGTYTLKAQIENGQNFLKVENACVAEDATKAVRGEYQLYEFTIDTTAAMAMNLFAQSTDAGIELTWNQDDYDTLMGYNIYRSDSKDGNFVKINPSVLLPTDSSFIDDNAEAGKTYWYTFTVVLSDFSESAPAGKVYCTAEDTLLPTVYHTPVNQGYENNNLVISCTASDNMKISYVTLYYRTIGSNTWKTLSMSKVNDKYSATIFGSELTLYGIEYYIEASDGFNVITKASAETPYQVVIKDASSLTRMGDVDGSGSVTTKDALMLMQCLNDELILTDDEFKRADLNGDGQLSSAEALRILQYVNGKVNTLEM